MAQIQRNQAASGMMPAPGQAYGVDPITGAPIGDKFAAQNLLNPSPEMASTVGGYMARSGPQMIPGLPGRGGRGGGGGGSMGPRQPRRKIMNLGARNTQEFTAQNGGLSGPRTSALDAAYGEGDFSRPGMPAPAATAPAQPAQLPGGGYDVPLSAFDKPEEQGMPKAMAKGGTMKPDNIYTVGEKGPEMVVPTGDGNMHVIPHGATKKLLSMIPGLPTPRAEGGVMETYDPSLGFAPGQPQIGSFAGGETPYGPVYADRTERGVPIGNLPMGVADEMGMMQPGGGYQPDPLAGTPYGMVNGIAPAFDRQELRGAIRGNILGMQSGPMVRPGDNQMINDSVTGQTVPLAEMRDRVAMRGIDANNELFDQRDRTERNRVQQDLAMRASRPALGTPTAPAEGLPGMPTMTPSTQRALQRNTERLMRSPEGAVLAMQQGQEAARSGQKVQERMDMINPIPVGETGDYIIPLTGQYINGKTGETRQGTIAEMRALGLEPESAENGVVKYGKPKTPQQGKGPFELIKGELIFGADGVAQTAPDRVFDAYTGLLWNAGDPIPPEVQAARRAAAATAAPASAGAGAGGANVAAAGGQTPYNPFQ